MISMEDWITIRNLKKRNPNMGTKAIAKKLGLSRNTVKNALRSEDPPEYKRETVTLRVGTNFFLCRLHFHCK